MVTSPPKNSLLFKALIISGYAPPASSGSGLMMYNLLKQFPEGSFAILTADEVTDSALSKYRLNVPYYYYGNEFTSLQFNTDENSLLQKSKKIIKNTPVIKFFGQIFLLLFLVRKIVDVGKVAVSKERPSILIAYSDFGPCLCATYILHKITGIPFAIYMYDMYVGNKLPFIFKVLANILEPKLFANAKHIFVMCDPLKEHYAQKYGRKDITIIYNSLINMEPRTQAQKKVTSNDVFTIAYLGSIYFAQEQALHNLISAVKSITELRVHLAIYTPHTKAFLGTLDIHEDEHIRMDSCAPEEVQSVLDDVDLVFIGLSFDTKYPELINTSSPGRMCDFLRSNTPILIHAPRESFVSTYAKKHDFAFVVDQNDVNLLANEIRSIIKNEVECKDKVLNAQRIGQEFHDAKRNSHIYLNTLSNLPIKQY